MNNHIQWEVLEAVESTDMNLHKIFLKFWKNQLKIKNSTLTHNAEHVKS